jgi:hypothetical protein
VVKCKTADAKTYVLLKISENVPYNNSVEMSPSSQKSIEMSPSGRGGLAKMAFWAGNSGQKFL